MNKTARTTRRQNDATPGFDMKLTEDTNLGIAMVIAEDEEGTTKQPIAVASTIGEAREMAAADLKGRLKRLGRDADPGLCPYEYKVWARGTEGEYILAATISVASLA